MQNHQENFGKDKIRSYQELHNELIFICELKKTFDQNLSQIKKTLYRQDHLDKSNSFLIQQIGWISMIRLYSNQQKQQKMSQRETQKTNKFSRTTQKKLQQVIIFLCLLISKCQFRPMEIIQLLKQLAKFVILGKVDYFYFYENIEKEYKLQQNKDLKQQLLMVYQRFMDQYLNCAKTDEQINEKLFLYKQTISNIQYLDQAVKSHRVIGKQYKSSFKKFTIKLLDDLALNIKIEYQKKTFKKVKASWLKVQNLQFMFNNTLNQIQNSFFIQLLKNIFQYFSLIISQKSDIIINELDSYFIIQSDKHLLKAQQMFRTIDALADHQKKKNAIKKFFELNKIPIEYGKQIKDPDSQLSINLLKNIFIVPYQPQLRYIRKLSTNKHRVKKAEKNIDFNVTLVERRYSYFKKIDQLINSSKIFGEEVSSLTDQYQKIVNQFLQNAFKSKEQEVKQDIQSLRKKTLSWIAKLKNI